MFIQKLSKALVVRFTSFWYACLTWHFDRSTVSFCLRGSYAIFNIIFSIYIL